MEEISRILMLSGLSRLKSFVNCILRGTYGSVSKKLEKISRILMLSEFFQLKTAVNCMVSGKAPSERNWNKSVDG